MDEENGVEMGEEMEMEVGCEGEIRPEVEEEIVRMLLGEEEEKLVQFLSSRFLREFTHWLVVCRRENTPTCFFPHF